MAAPQDVHVRICNQEIVKFDLEVKALIQDIRDCSGPLSALTELNTKVKEKFQHLRRRIQELEQSAKEQDKESEKQVLLQEVENHKKQLLSNQTSWRKANLTCKIAIDNLEKAELLQGGDLLRQRKTTKESLAQTSSGITESLMGISRMMSQQVQQSEEAMQTLVWCCPECGVLLSPLFWIFVLVLEDLHGLSKCFSGRSTPGVLREKQKSPGLFLETGFPQGWGRGLRVLFFFSGVLCTHGQASWGIIAWEDV
ncbi:vesicle transport protein SEC20 isoform X1 [Ursus americanus]|uniref:vesicle transport protein SEC20 isoform X1 n=1 Tax=Ursus americanus TaxID=9643 RepID=UPI001E67D132|nr:vesicle transport protein SEC20 isoform X1 [Ursus americanus]